MRRRSRPAPYGSWASPFPIELLTDGRRRASARSAPPTGVRWWLEGRPEEGGRQVLVRRERDGSLTRLTPEGFNVRCRVHEYGGGAYADRRRPRRRLRLRDRPAPPGRRAGRPRAAHAGRPRLAVRRPDPRSRPRTGCSPSARTTSRTRSPATARPRTRSSRSTSATAPSTVLAEGSDFFAAPRLSPDGRRLAWLALEPPEPAVGRHGARARRPRRGRAAGRRARRRRQPVGLDRPAALVAGRRPPLRRRARRLDEPVSGSARTARSSGSRRRSRPSSRSRTGCSALANYAFARGRHDRRRRPERRPRPAVPDRRRRRRRRRSTCRSPRSATSRSTADRRVFRAAAHRSAVGDRRARSRDGGDDRSCARSSELDVDPADVSLGELDRVPDRRRPDRLRHLLPRRRTARSAARPARCRR